MSKRGNLRRGFLYFLVAMLLVLVTAAFVRYTETEQTQLTGNTITVMERDNAVRLHDTLTTLPNEDEGTIVIWTKPPMRIFGQFDDTHQYIIFLTVDNIPGLRIVYNMQTSRFEAGTPLMESTPVDIFDLQAHQFVYTYRKDYKQAIFLDGQKVAESDFRPAKISMVTGFVIRDLFSIINIDLDGAEVSVYDRMIREEDISKI